MPLLAKTPFSSFSLPVILALLIPLFIASAWIIVSALDYHNSDFFTFWLAGRLISNGQNPYDTTLWLEGHQLYGTDWVPNSIFPYPLPLAFITLPLGLFPLKTAYFIWICLSQLFITLSIYLSVSWDKTVRIKHLFLPLLFAAFLFRPALVTLRNGQLSAFLLFVLALTIYLWNHQKWWQGAVVASLLILKPTIGLPVLGLSFLYLLILKKVQSIGALVLSISILAVFGWLIDPDWVSQFLTVGSGKFSETFGYNPTVWGLAGYGCQQANLCTTAVGGALALLLTLVIIYLIFTRGRQIAPGLMLSLIIPVSLLVTPYLWAYDQILLIISISVLAEKFTRSGYPYLLVASFPIIFSLISLLLLYLAVISGRDAWSAVLSFLILVIVWLQIPQDPPDSVTNSISLEQIL